MPSTRHIATEQAYPASRLAFPKHDHLLITTPSAVYAWDAAGLHTIFTSSKSGIVAAREAKDGSGVLAVADKHVVVLHDTKREQEQSWGLHADEDEVRQLEYAQDAKWLYLSTNLTNDVQRYSTERARLLSPAQSHPSAPIALAVSPTGHLMVSASDNPPVVYLKSLQHNTHPILIEPRASSATVSMISFHSERPNVFLLGFRDGTVAAYDATRVSRRNRGSFSNQEVVNDGEIAHFKSLHRTTSRTVTSGGVASKHASIAGAAFLQGYKSRVVTVGSDGRCRLVDFADGGIILRSWHAKAPLTSVSVLSIKEVTVGIAEPKRSTSRAESFMMGGPTSTNNLIAISRTDGKVQIYDSVGLLLEQKTITQAGDKVLSVEWVKGPSPAPIAARPSARELSYESITLPTSKVEPVHQLESAVAIPVVQPKSGRRRRSTLNQVTPQRRASALPPPQPSARSDRRFTIHPDEDENGDGTVKHTPGLAKFIEQNASANHFLDLFSPVKAVEIPKSEPPQKLLTSPRPRLRISSQTFSSPNNDMAGHLRPDAIEPSHSASSIRIESAHKPALNPVRTGDMRRASTRISPLSRRHITFKPVHRPSSGSAHAKGMPAVPANENAKVLADLRKMSKSHPATQGSVLAPYAASKTNTPATLDASKPVPPTPERHEQPHHATNPLERFFHHGKEKKRPRVGIGKQKSWHPGNVLERESTWPTDSMLEDSLEADDIWITDASEKENELSQRRRMAPFLDRPPGRQTSRSRVTSKGTTSRTQAAPISVEVKPESRLQHLDGSVTDQFETAQSQLSPDGTFSPVSEDIRQLFPRASSLSPQGKRGTGKRSSRSPRSPRVLQEIAGNSLARTKSEAKSPWAKAKAVKSQSCADAAHKGPGMVKTLEGQWHNCEVNSLRIGGLENELARLRGEVLVLKAAMRRAGVPLPASMRTMR